MILLWVYVSIGRFNQSILTKKASHFETLLPNLFDTAVEHLGIKSRCLVYKFLFVFAV
jgi:hypothetical protein